MMAMLSRNPNTDTATYRARLVLTAACDAKVHWRLSTNETRSAATKPMTDATTGSSLPISTSAIVVAKCTIVPITPTTQ